MAAQGARVLGLLLFLTSPVWTLPRNLAPAPGGAGDAASAPGAVWFAVSCPQW